MGEIRESMGLQRFDPSRNMLHLSSGPAAAAQPQDDGGFWAQPLWGGAPVKRWHGAVAGVLVAAFALKAAR